jgi:hypothetical protein
MGQHHEKLRVRVHEQGASTTYARIFAMTVLKTHVISAAVACLAMALVACGAGASTVTNRNAPTVMDEPSVSDAAAGSASSLSARPARGTVRFVVLVSSDREPRDDYVAAVREAALGLQRFYGAQLGGWTFALTPSVVEVVRSDKTAMWFTENPRSGHKDGWGFQNALAEARRIFGTEGWGEHVWVLYSDGPGNSGRGGGGVAYMPEDDLLGLIGAHPTQPSIARWIAGGGHELGHAFGLPHPPDMAAVPNAIMGAGFYHCWPNQCELTPEDRAILSRSAFFAPGPDATKRMTARLWYDGGAFLRLEPRGGGPAFWEERKTNPSFSARFEEVATWSSPGAAARAASRPTADAHGAPSTQ